MSTTRNLNIIHLSYIRFFTLQIYFNGVLLEDSGIDQLSGGIEAIDWFGISLL